MPNELAEARSDEVKKTCSELATGIPDSIVPIYPFLHCFHEHPTCVYPRRGALRTLRWWPHPRLLIGAAPPTRWALSLCARHGHTIAAALLGAETASKQATSSSTRRQCLEAGEHEGFLFPVLLVEREPCCMLEPYWLLWRYWVQCCWSITVRLGPSAGPEAERLFFFFSI